MDAPSAPPRGLYTVSSDERLWAAIAHLSGLACYMTGFGHIVAPLVIYLWKRDESPYVADAAREALNFNISVTIYGIVCGLLILVVIGFPLLIILSVFHLVCAIIAGLRVYDGIPYRYPLNLRLVK